MSFSKISALMVLATSLWACAPNSRPQDPSAGPQNKAPSFDPNSINMKEYPNIRGQIYGTWTSEETTVKDKTSGRVIKETIHFYISNLKTAARLTCTENSTPLADLLQVANAAADGAAVDLQQQLQMQHDDLCNFKLPVARIPYQFVGGTDQVLFNLGASSLGFKRTTESPIQNAF